MSQSQFDFSECAELYIANMRHGGQKSMAYRRFDSAAEAIQYSIEKLRGSSLRGTILDAGGKRYAHSEIRELYESDAYPLVRSIADGPSQ
mgnify:CR=1 FL=1